MNDWDHENSKVRKDQDEWESANGNDRPNEHEDNERKGAWEADKNDGSARDNVDKRRGEWDGDFVSDENNEWDEPRENEWERDEDENWRDDEVERDNENRMDQNKTNRNGSRYKDNANDDDGNEEDEEDWYDEYEKDRARLDGDDSGGKGPAARVKRCCATCYTPSCEFRGPCKFPHGCCYSVMGIMVAIFGLMMNLYVIGSCMFQRIKKINTITGDPIPGSERGFGFLGRETDYGITPDYRQCSWYTAEEYDILFDGWMHTGRIFAFLSAIIATIGFVVLFLTCCMAFSPSMFEKWLFWMYIVAAITVAFSFFIFGSEYCADNDCKVADGCGWAISAFMFHLVAANTVKSFAAPNAPASKRSPKKAANNDDDEYDDDEDDDNEDLDDLHYENESDKYPAPHPDGPRGVVADKDGIKEYDDGEDYYNEMGRLISGDEQGDYKRTRKADNDDEDLDDISDHDLENYASDDEDDENGKATKKKQYDQNGNPIFDPDAIDQTGNLGVGYQGDDGTSREAYDEHGNRLRRFDDNGHPIYNGDVDEYGNPVPRHHHHQNVDDFGNPVQSHFVDEFGNPVVSQQQQQYDDFGHQELDEYGNHMYSDNDGQHQNNYTTLDSSRGTVQNNGASDPFVEAGNDTGTRQGNGQQQYNRRDNDDDDDEGPVFT